MNNFPRILLIICFFHILVYSRDQMIAGGPMLHANFSNSRIILSWGIEISYWAEFASDNNWYSVDIGIDIPFNYRDKNGFCTNIYSEFQMAVLSNGIASGFSIGPILNFDRNNMLGLQGSFWGDIFVGADCRLKLLKNTTFISPGIFTKIIGRSNFKVGFD